MTKEFFSKRPEKTFSASSKEISEKKEFVKEKAQACVEKISNETIIQTNASLFIKPLNKDLNLKILKSYC
ncbi:MAG: hypothetical protein ACTSRU_12520 [Candidatus Hodarchaeales archaeon]